MAAQHSDYSARRNGSMPREGANSRMALDNIIRRELRVSDPNNAQEVAQALLTRYQDRPQAIAISREAEGLPFLSAPTMPTPMQRVETSSDAELKQAMDDVERDLHALTGNAILKDVTPELEGWGMAIRSAMTEAFHSARFALDSSQRDKTFGIRRTLGDYARMARLVGALSSPVVNVNYRNLAQSIDEVTAVLLVTMGESLANVSFNRSRFLLQVPYAELQARRDSVIYGLRNFLGSTQEAYEPNEWPRGVNAYRALYKFLDDQGQGDLRSLLVENELSRLMDTLIQRARHGNVEGLRQLGATAQLDLPRLNRLVRIGLDPNLPVVESQAPPLRAFLEALQLFIDSFDSTGGFRLLRLARPPILFYGLYGSSGSDAAEARLLELAIERNRLAEYLDCYAQCGCDPGSVKCLILLDKILYDLDRAIDLYALGTAENIEPEYRAVAYSYIMDAVLRGIAVNNTPPYSCLVSTSIPSDLSTRIINTLRVLRSLLFTPIDPTIFRTPLPTAEPIPPVLAALLAPPAPPAPPPLPNSPQNAFRLVTQELTIQDDAESHWEDLVQTMAPACIPFRTVGEQGVFDVIKTVINNALDAATGTGTTNPIDFALPAQYEVSLEDIADDQDRTADALRRLSPPQQQP